MLSYILRRLLATVPVVLMVAVIVFAVLRLTPGDPASIIAGDSATPEQVQDLRRHMGLDKPIVTQFLVWGWQLLQGDLGTSLISGQPVSQMVAGRIGPTLALASTTLVLTLLLALPLGILAAARQGRLLDRAVMSVSVLGFSVPVFVTGYVLILLFSIKLGWFPVQGYAPLSSGLGEFLQRLALPSLALSTVYVALIARITRSSIVEIMGEDFIRTARSKGLTERAVLMRHALGNAAVPIITIVGVGIGLLLSGVVVTESVFNLPGLGRLVVEAVLARDYPVIQGLTLLFSLLYILINLIVDLLYTVFDPRIRY
ncbi:ABC transporter permease [Piscinibacter sakaiensis]|uniref:Dipeptide transport system permease protein DppB n=1 Tax=Piscinibacter sakaiensis TaxID=1547922 RepID=A0A0K8NZP4_PISS1|nr:ABC transporter permease [Piscinibacter sakaiensis]GAP35400.1 dipeptide transport system permease protein DppB [Piscinibacter sakaiensis]